jgi:SPP1 gp7 family putative phage head morphogenesis protein
MPRFSLRRRQPPATELASQVAELLKASVPGLGMLPAGTTATTPPNPTNPGTMAGARGDQSSALPRDPTDALVAFGPGRPLYPAPLDPRRAGGRAEPRRSEYPVSWNLQLGQDPSHVPWKLLRDFADRIDMVRRCIELRKSELVSIEWDITVSQKALQRVMAATDEKNEARAARMLRDQYEDDIERLIRFWQRPDPVNVDGWDDWLVMALEEHFVLDALTIYPRMTRGGDLFALEILDGSTIKPLLDHRGGRPMPPAPAYQQILYGFPRGEFTASEQALVDGEYAADQLVYRPRVRRSFTPYGLSNTEQALLAGALYAKRQQWLADEYDQGTTPRTWMKTDSDYTPDMLRSYEAVLNDEIQGDNAERMRAKLLNRGFDPVAMKQFEEMYKPDFDEYLVRVLCLHFDVMPTELGFPPRHGLGGKGHQEGEENTTYRKAIKPLLGWVVSILNNLSTTYLAMPADLTFTFQGLEVQDALDEAKARDLDIRNGSVTLNGVQAALSRPLYDFPEADMPFIVTGNTVTFLEGASEPESLPSPLGQTGAPGQSGTPAPGEGDRTPKPGESPPPGRPEGAAADGPARAEARKFATFAEKRIKAGKGWRDFAFQHLDEETAGRLNKLGAAGDLDMVKAAVADVGKARAPQGGARPQEVQDWPGWKFDQQIARHYAPIFQRLLTGLGNWHDLAAEYLRVHGTSKATAITPERASARSFVHQHLSQADLATLVATLRLLYTDGYLTGSHAAVVTLERLGVQATATLGGRVSWTAWRPGDPETARLLEAGGTPGLEGLLAQADITIKSVRDGYLNRLGDTLAAGVQRGASVDELARDLRGLLTIDRATMIAHTETARAMTVATMETYRANQVAGKAVITAEDERVCQFCAGNEAAGPIPLDDAFPYGEPPTHPLCRCAIVPYLASEMGMTGEPVLVGADELEE